MNREKLVIKTSLIGIIMNLALVAAKAAVGFLSGSIAIILDALNNLTDIFSAAITILGTKLAGRAPDKEHPYGHGRIEYLTSLIIGVIILATGLSALKEAIPKIFHPELANFNIISAIIIALAVITKFVFGRYAKKIGQKANSQSLIATSVDATFDSLLSASTLVGIIITLIFKISIDGWLGVLISAFIIKASIEILHDAYIEIIGSRPDGELSKSIKKEIQKFSNVSGVYDLILHNYGPNDMIGSVHIQLPDTITAKQIHQLTRDITTKIYAKYHVIMTVGIYAENTTTKSSQKIYDRLTEIIKQHPDVLQLHGFYVDEKNKIVAFDIVIDYKYNAKDELKNEIIKSISSEFPKYTYQVTLDADFSD